MLNTNTQYEQFGMGLQQAYLQDLRERERAKMHDYIKAREYYDGIHYTQLNDRTREFLNVDRDADFTVNYCPIVVNAQADRLAVTGFEVETIDSADTTSQAELYWQWWRFNRMDRKQGIVHKGVIRDSDTFVLVEWDSDNNIPRFHYEPAYAGEGVMVYYSEEHRDKIEFASKAWNIKHGRNAGKATRLNLYFHNRIEKYISYTTDGSVYTAYQDDDTDVIDVGLLGKAGITWWTDTRTKEGNPLGVPIVHFKYDDTGDGFGNSLLARVMPVQDALNKSMVDLLGVLDTEAFSPIIFKNLTPTEIKMSAGGFIGIEGDNADVTRLEAGSPQAILEAYNMLVMEIARISGTPLSYFQSSGQVAAEGTLKQQEVVLVAQTIKNQTDFGNAWEECMHIATRLYNAFGDGEELPENVLINALWKDAETRNDKAHLETLLLKKEIGVPDEQLQAEADYDVAQRAKFARSAIRRTALTLRQQATTQTPVTDTEADNPNNPQDIDEDFIDDS